jgi:hypothetical protein
MKGVFAALFAVLMVLAVSGQKPADKPDKAKQAKRCYSKQTAGAARRAARVYRANPNYDPVLGYDPAAGPRPGSPLVDENGFAKPVNCIAAPKPKDVGGTLPKFYCSVEGNVDEDGNPVRYKIKPHFKGQSRDKRDGEIYGEFLSSRFSKAVGFFADDEWVADVTCPDCEKSLSKPFQGAPFTPFQPAAGIELSIADEIDEDCEGDGSADLGRSLSDLSQSHPAEVDAFKLWLAFIDHDDTKSQNQRFACLQVTENGDTLACAPGESIFYVSDMGSSFGSSTASEKKATLERWKGKDPIKVRDGRCTATAKGVGNASVGEEGRALLADELQRLLDAQAKNGTITKVFEASRNAERDQPAAAWTAEFIRKAKTIINARCR